MAELQVHGSQAILDRLSEALLSLGLRMAERGEFARRALQSGKMDLLDVEALDDLIRATDSMALDLAQGQSDKARNKVFKDWRQRLMQLQAACEALIDFPEEDLPKNVISRNNQDLMDLYGEVQALERRSDLAQVRDQGLEVLLVGPPNVGKSTLLNALAGYERAIVSPLAGTTRDFVELSVRLGSHEVRFVDTAGLRDSQDSIEQKGVARTQARLESATLILNLYEQPSLALDLKVSSPVWNVQTKDFDPHVRSIAAGDPDQPGVQKLLREIEIWLDQKFLPLEGEIAFTRLRQVFHVKQMVQALEDAHHPHILPEMQAESLRQASDSLGHLTGKIHVEDVLDQLFSGFCIGK